MATARDILHRIRSIKNISKVTGALEAVAAVKIRHVQKQVVASRPYIEAVQEILRSLASRSSGLTVELLEPRSIIRTIAVLMISSDRGLAGSYNVHVVNKAIAFASAIVNAHAGANAAYGQMGPFGVPMASYILAAGYANAGIIAGTAIVGAYDKGGNIPSNKLGIVSEYGDELVNGVLVKGPARVTGREDTEKLLQSSGGGSPIINLNTLPGETADITQNADGSTEITMRAIAEKVFADRIDDGVAGVFKNSNSRADKQFKRSYGSRRNL